MQAGSGVSRNRCSGRNNEETRGYAAALGLLDCPVQAVGYVLPPLRSVGLPQNDCCLTGDKEQIGQLTCGLRVARRMRRNECVENDGLKERKA